MCTSNFASTTRRTPPETETETETAVTVITAAACEGAEGAKEGAAEKEAVVGGEGAKVEDAIETPTPSRPTTSRETGSASTARSGILQDAALAGAAGRLPGESTPPADILPWEPRGCWGSGPKVPSVPSFLPTCNERSSRELILFKILVWCNLAERRNTSTCSVVFLNLFLVCFRIASG